MRKLVDDTAATIISRIRAKHGIASPTDKPADASKKPKKANPAPAPVAVPVAKPKLQLADIIKKAANEKPFCACQCGGRTKGGKYLPGHDSKHRSALAVPKENPLCGCGCGERTRGGRFCPGHDAKYHSALRKQEKEQAAGRVLVVGAA